ncbi:hypothetical protein EJ08DRAFT_738766 [Tothia fuscella]|uniref:Uncharacterized protein n=1 Tax=Tothia fuscella TaxID=1048955 RepID=A0A9P4TSY2_9PEZI|nr:hypothetical protein EJ08DRAFT_738766 [Tothia fuscella]
MKVNSKLHHDLTSQLLRTCSQVYQEGVEVLYGCNTFRFYKPSRTKIFLDRIGAMGKRQIRMATSFWHHELHDDLEGLDLAQLVNLREICFIEYWELSPEATFEAGPFPNWTHEVRDRASIAFGREGMTWRYEPVKVNYIPSERFEQTEFKALLEIFNNAGTTVLFTVAMWRFRNDPDSKHSRADNLHIWYQLVKNAQSKNGYDVVYIREKAFEDNFRVYK